MGKQSTGPCRVLVPQLPVTPAGFVRCWLLSEPKAGQWWLLRCIFGISRWWKSHCLKQPWDYGGTASPRHLVICTALQVRQGALPRQRQRPAPRALHTGQEAGQGRSAEPGEHITCGPWQVCGWRGKTGLLHSPGLMGGITHLTPQLCQTGS